METSDCLRSLSCLLNNILNGVVSNDPLDFFKNAVVDSDAEVCYTCFR